MKNERKWYDNPKEYDDVVLSSSVTLCRNLDSYDFKDKIGGEDAYALVQEVGELTTKLSECISSKFSFYQVNTMPDIEKAAFVEQGIMSRALSTKKQPTGLMLSANDGVSIYINEDDHIHINVRTAGNNIRKAYMQADMIDDFFDRELHYAFNETYGYLTTCMTDVGTGLRVNYILSLPGLGMSGKIGAIKDEVGKVGAVLKDAFEDGGKNSGFLYSITNRKSLACSEQEILETLEQIVGQVVEMERRARTTKIESEPDETKDKVYRSYGVLKYAKMISCKDAMMLLTQLKLGLDCGIIRLKCRGVDIYKLMTAIQPSEIVKRFGSTDARGADKARAKYLGEHLPELDDESSAATGQDGD